MSARGFVLPPDLASRKRQKADTWPAADGQLQRRTEWFDLSMSWFSIQNKGFHSETLKDVKARHPQQK